MIRNIPPLHPAQIEIAERLINELDHLENVLQSRQLPQREQAQVQQLRTTLKTALQLSFTGPLFREWVNNRFGENAIKYFSI